MRILLLLLITFPSFASLEELEKRVAWDLDHADYPGSWRDEEPGVLEVAVIGAGMAGSAAAYGLFQMGIHEICLFDQSPHGEEGPWITSARMQILRSGKFATGPSFSTASLSFQAWYEAVYGESAWEPLSRATPKDWMDYLVWFQKVLKIPLVSCCRLSAITPINDSLFRLDFDKEGLPYSVLARKIVLATGRAGLGGVQIPAYMTKIPKQYFAHTNEKIDFAPFKGKKIAILGCGASAFDAAACALEEGAVSVDLIFRRDKVPHLNLAAHLVHVGAEQGFHLLPAKTRFDLISYALQFGVDPPVEAILRIGSNPAFHLVNQKIISDVFLDQDLLVLETSSGKLSCDFLILATGFDVNPLENQELKYFSSNIRLFKDTLENTNKLGYFPDLGPHFQFQEKIRGITPFLKHIYCFNYGALISHGLTSSAIDPLSVGARRLTQGIAADFFLEEIENYIQQFQSTSVD